MRKNNIFTTAVLLIVVGLVSCAMPVMAADYTSPRPLEVGDTYIIVKDAHTGDEATAEPKYDANDGLNGDNPYYRRYNIGRAHIDYWYTSNYQSYPGEPDPNGPQWVDYIPPLSILGPGRYRITAEYRNTGNRASYEVPYNVYHRTGTTTIWRSQRVGEGYITFDLGEYDLWTDGYVRVEDKKRDGTWGGESITFNKMRFTYLGSTDTQAPSVPTNVQASGWASNVMQITWTASIDNLAVAGYKVFRNGTQVGTTSTTSYLDAGLTANTSYSYTIAAYDGAGNTSAQSTPAAVGTTLTPDSQGPSVPTNVTAAAVSNSAILVNWSASTDNRGVLGYKIYRNGTQVGTSSTTSYTNTGLQSGVSYSFTVAAYDGDGNNSAQSSPPAVAAPHSAIAVTNLVPSNYVVTTFNIELLLFIDRTYTISSMPEKYRGLTGIRTANDDKDNTSLDFRFTINQSLDIYVCLADGAQPTTPLLTGFADTGHDIYTTDRTYRIFRKTYPAGQVNLGPKPGAGNGKSMYIVLMDFPDAQPPSVPTNVMATPLTPTSIRVNWVASTDNIGVAGYKIFRDGTQVETATTTSYTNSGLQPETMYSYTVSAYDTAGNNSSQSSPPATATTPSDTMPPSITQDPQSKGICEGETLTLSVTAIGSAPLSYQWQFNGSDLSNSGQFSGVDTKTLTVSNMGEANAGGYRCIVSNAYGSATSGTAAINVIECLPHIARSNSNRFITYNGRTIMMVGDSGTQCVPQNKNLNYRQWIDDCNARGIRAIHVWSFLVPRQKQDGSMYEPRWGYVIPALAPWARKTSGPLATDQLYQWDLKSFDESPGGYWARMRDMCEYAKTKDVTVGIQVFFGWAKWISTWEYHPFNVANGGHLTDNMAPQIIATPGTEVWEEPWSDTWSNAKKTQWVWENFSKKLIDDLGSKGNVWFGFMDEHSYSEGNCGDHFRDFFKNRGMLWADWDQRRSTVDMVTEQPSGADKNAGTLVYSTKQPYRPFFMLEKDPYVGDGFRTAIWTVSIAGGHYYYHDDEGQETAQTGIMGYDPNVQNSNRSANQMRRDWLGHASRLFNQHVQKLDQMWPNNSLGSGAYVLAVAGQEYVAYSMPGVASFNLNLSAVSGNAICRFYNPRTGVFGSTFNVAGGAVRTFTKPDSNDWALHVTTITDTEPPSVPTNVAAVGTSATRITVSWTASTDNIGVTGYRIYRDGTQVGTSTTTSYVDSGLTSVTSYSYTVSAYDGAGNHSAQSSPPAVGTSLEGDDQPPSVPTDVNAIPLSQNSILVMWTASTDNVGVVGYKVYRNGTHVGTPTTTTYTDSGLQAGTTYSYRVSAYDAEGNSSARSLPPAVATTEMPSMLMQDNFDNSNIDARWLVRYDNCSVDYAGTVSHAAGLQDACGTVLGYAYRQYAGDRCMIWKGSFTSAGYVNVKLTFWYRNDSGGSIQAFVLRNGAWTSMGTVGVVTNWTKQEYNLTGTITGVRFDLIGGSNTARRIDCISITGTPPDTTPPTVPTNVTATALSESEIQVSWSPSVDNGGVKGYKIYRNGVQVGVYEPTVAAEGRITGPFATGTGKWSTLTNGGFETGNMSGWPATYDPQPGSIVASNARAAVGTWSAKSQATAGGGFANWQQNIPVVSGQTYVLSGFFYTGGSTGYAALDLNDIPNEPESAPSMNVNQWQFAWKTWVADRSAVNARMVRWTSGGVDGGVHYDEVALTPAAQFLPPSAPVLFFTDSGLSPATTYSYTVSAYDLAGNNSAQSSPPAVATTLSELDIEPPSVPTDVTALAYSDSSIVVSWTASTDNVEVSGYKVFRDGTEVGTSFGTSYLDAYLASGTTCSYTVSAYDAAANDSAQSSPPAVATTGIAVDIGGAKELADEITVTVTGKVVTAVFGGFLYIEEPDRFAGIRVVAAQRPEELAINDIVKVTGILSTINGERCIGNAVVISEYDSRLLDPVGLNNKAVGGGDWKYESATGAGQKGVKDATGANNIGLLITTWGSYTQLVDPSTFAVDDGSGNPITCVAPDGVTLDPGSQYVAVTGISSCYEDGGELYRRLLVRKQEDIAVLQ